MQKKYPFKFLDAYDSRDKDIFFGRQEEINSLYAMVFETDLLLIYGASGTGKTSLIRCGLAGKFAEYEWLPLYVRRGQNINVALEKVLDEAIGQTIGEDEVSYAELDAIISKYQTKQKLPVADAVIGTPALLKAVYRHYFRPVYLVFDQFEELYILGNKQEQAEFINTVQQILESHQPVKLIFSIREEYLGHLYEFERAVPQLLRKKLRIEAMSLDKVQQVMEGIGEHDDTLIRFDGEQYTEIAAAIFSKIKSKEHVLTIQLPYLQVFLDKLYISLTHDETRQMPAEFSVEAIDAIKSFDDVLRDFLEEQASQIHKDLKKKHTDIPDNVSWQILSPFATIEGTKEPISIADLQQRLSSLSPLLVNDAVHGFEKSRILRFDDQEERYELAHDTLARQIAARRKTEENNILEVERLISSQARLKNEARELLTEKQLIYIEPYLDKIQINLDGEELISKSRNELRKHKRKSKKRQRLIIMIAAIVVVVMATLAAWAFNQQHEAEKNADETKKALDSYKQEKAAKELLSFKELEERAYDILTRNTPPGCPSEILFYMRTMAKQHPDSTAMYKRIQILQQKNPECK
jgi:hypothetical protein